MPSRPISSAEQLIRLIALKLEALLADGADEPLRFAQVRVEHLVALTIATSNDLYLGLSQLGRQP